MNGPVKHGATSNESFITVGKMVIPQHFVSVLDVLKSICEPISFYCMHKCALSHGIKLEYGVVIPDYLD